MESGSFILACLLENRNTAIHTSHGQNQQQISDSFQATQISESETPRAAANAGIFKQYWHELLPRPRNGTLTANPARHVEKNAMFLSRCRSHLRGSPVSYWVVCRGTRAAEPYLGARTNRAWAVAWRCLRGDSGLTCLCLADKVIASQHGILSRVSRCREGDQPPSRARQAGNPSTQHSFSCTRRRFIY